MAARSAAGGHPGGVADGRCVAPAMGGGLVSVRCLACMVKEPVDGARPAGLDDALTFGIVRTLVAVHEGSCIELCGTHAQHVQKTLASEGYAAPMVRVPDAEQPS